MISPGEARHGRPPARSSRARARERRRGQRAAERLGSAAAVAHVGRTPETDAWSPIEAPAERPWSPVEAADDPWSRPPEPPPEVEVAEPEGATGWPPTGRIPEHRANEAAWLQQGTEPDGGVDAPADVAPEAPPHWADEPTVPLVTVEATGAPSVSTSTGEATTGATLAAGNTTTATLERPAADETPPRGGTRSRMRNTIEWVVIIGAALIAAIVIKTFLIQAFYIPSASMEHTLNIQDRVLVNKLSYRLHDVHRGDIVVFERPPNDVGQIRDLIKRVVGLSGETVEGHDGSVYVNGRQLREPYLEQGITTADFSPQRIPDGYVWVMGDNRGNSSDSRVFGAIEESSIVGRAFVRVWPLSAVGLL